MTFIVAKVSTYPNVSAYLWVTTHFLPVGNPDFGGMKNILYLKSSLQGEASYSKKLGDAVIEKIQIKYPGSTVDELDLVESDIPHLKPEVLHAMFNPEPDQAAIQLSDNLVKQLFAADIIVIGAPLINFTIPSTLKAWIDHITRAGITFGYSENGPVGKVTGKKVYVAMSSGGVYSEGPGKLMILWPLTSKPSLAF
jgi:FMN-dependent NADH-azoreductase